MSQRSSSGQKTGKQSRKNGKRGVLPVLCRAFGLLLLLGVIALCMPVTLPRVLGYQVYDVISGSMEPEIPVGSVLFVKPIDPRLIAEGEIIAFMDTDAVVAHRVVSNSTAVGEFVTKGDANNTEDREPIPYSSLMGRVEMHLPFFGSMMALYASTIGKVYLFLTAGCGLMLYMLGNRIEERRKLG